MFDRAAMHLPRWRMRYRVSALAALLAAAAMLTQALLWTSPARAAGLYSCSSGFGNGTSCSNVVNNDEVSQRQLPTQVYRGDSRSPYDIFRHGFTAVGTDYNIPRHVRGGNAANSGYISTSAALSESETFARSQGGRNLASAASQPQCRAGRFAQWSTVPGLGWWRYEDCLNGWVEADSYVYVIDSHMARNALYIPDEVRGDPTLERYASQQEWAYVHHIPNTAVMGVRIYRMRARMTNGRIDFRTQTFTYDRYAGNSAHTQAQISYDPGADPAAHFGVNTDLAVPPIPGNPYHRGCATVNRCRGGNGG
ncbi:hypothetical protein ABZ490_40800 [Streptomyces sp. NPDC005811]|uniref:hypothetical protein n=1 Tax=Streptomyces sp. NPDC005811 TaxID=3154565 RepID=UPI0033E891CF